MNMDSGALKIVLCGQVEFVCILCYCHFHDVAHFSTRRFTDVLKVIELSVYLHVTYIATSLLCALVYLLIKWAH